MIYKDINISKIPILATYRVEYSGHYVATLIQTDIGKSTYSIQHMIKAFPNLKGRHTLRVWARLFDKDLKDWFKLAKEKGFDYATRYYSV